MTLGKGREDIALAKLSSIILFFPRPCKKSFLTFGRFGLRGCAIFRTGLLTDRNIKTVRQIAEICEENSMMLRELKEKTSSFPSQYFFKERKDIRKYQYIVWGGGAVNYSRIFAFRGESWILNPEKRRMIVLCLHSTSFFV